MNNINIVLSQTNYNEEEANLKLREHNNDPMSVIREYMGIKPAEKKTTVNSKSLNQEIYKQIRTTLDKSMKEYRENNPIDMTQVVNNLRESEERQERKNLEN